MAHQLEEWSNTTASFVSAREHAWHKLGVILPDTFTAAQAMEHAKLGNWNVRTVPLQTAPILTDEGVTAPMAVKDQFATVRTNPVTGGTDVLGVVGRAYTPIQNEAHADLLNTVVSESGAHFETAGSLRGGKSVFLSMKLPETMNIGGKDPMDLYLVALNSHDGSSAFRLLISPVRVVCANTQAAAISSARASFSIRHTSGAQGNIAAARQALGLTFKYVEAFEAEAEKMIQAEMTLTDFDKIVAELWQTESKSARSKTIMENRTIALDDLFTHSATNEDIRGTAWAGYQAITEYLDFFSPLGEKGTDATRAEKAVGTTGTALKVKAFDLIGASL